MTDQSAKAPPAASSADDSSESDQSLSPSHIRQRGNQLRSEPSLYLRQHAHNPVNWYPWGPEALERAQSEDKPIFLSIGYSSCHWCHVMEAEVFENDEIASFLNDNFISIKVDREERPDLDVAYMTAVQLLTGSGGWPMSVFLTPDQKPFYGGTYFPAEHFRVLTHRVLEVFRRRRTEVEGQAEALTAAMTQGQDFAPAEAIDEQLILNTVEQATEVFDTRWGGFQARMKFPTPLRWSFLLHVYRKTGEESCARMVQGTLDAMAAGGLYDQLGGGFHRYTVDETWLVPHFEKMLYDNAQLASLFLEAGVVFGNDRYLEVGRNTVDFLLRAMAHPQGGIYASFDADSGGVEGAYYVWTPEEIIQIAGPRDGKVLCRLLGVTEQGNFEQKNVLTRLTPLRAIAQECGLDPSEVQQLWDHWRPALLAFRAKRQAPTLDPKIITAWNGLALSALSMAAVALEEPRYRQAAERTAAYLHAVHRRADGRLWRVSNDGQPQHEATLEDYALLACGLLDLFQATNALNYLSWAEELVEIVRRHFGKRHQVYELTPQSVQAPLGRKVEVFDSVEPSGNSALVQAMFRIAELTGNRQYRQEAQQAVESQGALIRRAGMEMAWWLDASLKMAGPAYTVVIAGETNHPHTQALQQVLSELLPCNAQMITVPAAGPSAEMMQLLPTVEGKTALRGIPAAYVCQFGSCQAPTTDPQVLRRQLLAGWKGDSDRWL